jgi:hypothetical protein
MTRLGALAEGVKWGVTREAVGAERVLSLLRERFDDEGEGGTCNDCDEAMLGSDLTPPASLALRRRARSLCSLKSVQSAPHEAAASGNGARHGGREGGTATLLGSWGRAVAAMIGGLGSTGLSAERCAVHAPAAYALLCMYRCGLRRGSAPDVTPVRRQWPCAWPTFAVELCARSGRALQACLCDKLWRQTQLFGQLGLVSEAPGHGVAGRDRAPLVGATAAGSRSSRGPRLAGGVGARETGDGRRATGGRSARRAAERRCRGSRRACDRGAMVRAGSGTFRVRC